MENIFLHKVFYLQGIFNDIEQDTSFFDCKHKHMMKSRAPHDKVGVLYPLLPIEFHGFTTRIDFKGLSLFGSWPYLNFLEIVWVPLSPKTIAIHFKGLK